MLTLAQLDPDQSDETLLDLLLEETRRLLPNELAADSNAYYATLPLTPPGIRALAGIYDLDVSMAMDDLAWHFGNHDDERHIQETLWSLRELGDPEILSLFEQAVAAVRPHLETIRSGTLGADTFHDWLDETGIQAACDPLNDRLWRLKDDFSLVSLFQLAVNHARKHPERFIQL